MNDVPQYELLSAYLDGELAAPERAKVERLLASDPAARQLLDDLRALSNTLQSLPSERLKENLSEAVLQKAEREMLTGPPPKDDRPSPQGMAWWSIARRLTRIRTLVWLGITAAVAIMLSVTDPSRRPQAVRHELAQAPAKVEARSSADRPAERQTPAESPSIRALPPERNVSADESTKPGASVKLEPKLKGNLGLLADDKPAMPSLKASVAAEQPAVPASSTPSRPPAPAPVDALAKADKRDMQDVRKAETASPAGAATHAESSAGKSPAVVGKSSAMLARAKQAEEPSPEALAPRKDRVVRLPVLQVDCYVSAEAAQREDLERLLTRQKVVRRSRSSRLDDSASEERSGTAVDRDAEQGLSSVSGEMVRVLYCEATPAQVEAALTNLAARPGALIAVSATPSTGVGGRLPDDSSMSQFRQAPRREAAASESPRAAGASSSKLQPPAEAGRTPASQEAANAVQQNSLGSDLTLNARPTDRQLREGSVPGKKTIPTMMSEIARWTDRDQIYRVVFIVHQVSGNPKPAASPAEKP